MSNAEVAGPTANIGERTGRDEPLGLVGPQPERRTDRGAVAESIAVAKGLATVKTYAFASVDYPGAAWSIATDTDGVTSVGYFMFDPKADPPRPKAFTFSVGTYRILVVPNSLTSHAMGINKSGSIVGMYESLTGKRLGFVRSGVTFSDVEYPRAAATAIYDINDSGVVAGSYRDATGHYHGFTYSAGTYTPIDFPGVTDTTATGINAHGDVVGYYLEATTPHGFLLRAGVFTPIDFPHATTTVAWGINDASDIVGYYTGLDGVSGGFRSFVFADGAFSTFDVAGAYHTQVNGISNDGLVTGSYIDSLTAYHGFIGT